MNCAPLLLAVTIVIAFPRVAAAQAPAPPLSATQELEKSVPSVAQSFARSAMTAMREGKFADAKRDFAKVLALVPGNVPTTINLALIAYSEKDFTAAESLLKKAARAEPENGLPWLMLGVIHYEQDRLDAALAVLAQAVLYAPQDARAHHFLGVTAGKKGWYLAAEDELRKAIALSPDYGDAHFNLAAFYLQRNPPAVELARRHYEKAVDLGGARDPGIEKRLSVPQSE